VFTVKPAVIVAPFLQPALKRGVGVGFFDIIEYSVVVQEMVHYKRN
jgi:hypothetical protein